MSLCKSSRNYTVDGTEVSEKYATLDMKPMPNAQVLPMCICDGFIGIVSGGEENRSQSIRLQAYPPYGCLINTHYSSYRLECGSGAKDHEVGHCFPHELASPCPSWM